jgi:hypothetical protein
MGRGVGGLMGLHGLTVLSWPGPKRKKIQILISFQNEAKLDLIQRLPSRAQKIYSKI